jgi:hypothetical protein
MNGMARRRSGLPGMTDELRARARAWAERSCREQGVPLFVQDRKALTAVVELLQVGSRPAVVAARSPQGDARRRDVA